MRIVVATHGHCFDGLASAALFTFLARAVESSTAAFEYRACTYGPHRNHTTSALFNGDKNALLDFQFIPSRNLTWYFDHHTTAFVDRSAREFFESQASSGRYYLDSTAGSCATVIGRTMVEKWGLTLGVLEPLIELANRVDTAHFESASAAIDRSSPASRLVALAERHGNDAFLARWVPRLLEAPVDVVANDPSVARDFAEIDREQMAFVEHVRTRAIPRGSVIYVDLTDRVHATLAKFVTYALFPKSTYSVVIGRIPGAMRLSVGYNPWSGETRRHNLGELCQTYGGGGHPVVGGVAFPDEAVERARHVALSLVQVLAEG
jgi:hypothetical protein